MTDIARKVFDWLGVEPNEKFKIYDGYNEFNETFYINEELFIVDNNGYKISVLSNLLNGTYLIIKLPKKKKKLRDLTEKEFLNWRGNNCGNCKNCIFKNVICTCAGKYERLWVECKELYSDAFLNQEIEVKE